MNITETFYALDRAAWRAWLSEHHTVKAEIWLLTYNKAAGKPTVSYVDSVLEALCFGWIDGIAKSYDAERKAQRFTPRRPRGNWTELNKERARRLIAQGLMTDAGYAVLPDLDPSLFSIAPDIRAALQADDETWRNFQAFPELYQRVRVGYVEEQRRNPVEFTKRLDKLVMQTRANKMFGGSLE